MTKLGTEYVTIVPPGLAQARQGNQVEARERGHARTKKRAAVMSDQTTNELLKQIVVTLRWIAGGLGLLIGYMIARFGIF